MAKVYSLTVRNRAAAALLGVGVIALGAVFLTLGFALLLGLVVAGGVLGAGVAAYRLLRGGKSSPRHFSQIDLDQLTRMHSASGAGLDPSLEVKPTIKAIVRPLDQND
jgi:hypothetical protein